MAKYKYVIIGGGIAGGKACEGIRQVDSQGSIALITQEPFRPYQRPPLSKGYLQGEADLDKAYLESAQFYQEQHIEVIPEHRVDRIRPQKHEILAENGLILAYERLLLATGGHALRLDLPGSELEQVFTLRTIRDARNIREAAGPGQHALVMGGSFIGCEVAASLAQIGSQVTQIFPESRMLERIVTAGISKHLRNIYQQKGVRVLPGTVAKKLMGSDGQVSGAQLDNGENLKIDLVVMGVGIGLNTDLAKEAGLDVRSEDQAILVDEYLRTSGPDIYAAGDICAWPDDRYGRRLRVEHWDVARQQGLRAGRNMAGEEQAYTALPYFFSDLFDLSFEVWGNLDRWEQTVRRGQLDSGSFADYYFADDQLVGVLAVGRPDKERQAMQTLVKARPAYQEVAEVLADAARDLAEIEVVEMQT